MRVLGFEIKRLGGKPLGSLRQTQEAVILLQARVNLLEKHRKSVAVKTDKEVVMDNEISRILAQSDRQFTPGDDNFPIGGV